MENLLNYKDFFLDKGLWHVHTKYVDGEHTVDEICNHYKEEYKLICFTEHVRRKLTYNFNNYLTDINKAREKYPNLIILAGVEAKLLITGELDISDEVLTKTDVVFMAEHGMTLPLSMEGYFKYISALNLALKKDYVQAWCHCFDIAVKHGFGMNVSDVLSFSELCRQNNVVLEIPLIDRFTNSSIGELFVHKLYGMDLHIIQ